MTVAYPVDRRPAWADVARAQFHLLWASRRPWFVLTLFGLLGAFVFFVSPLIGFGGPDRMLVSAALPVTVAVLGALWGACIWWDEGPQRRGLHWSMPVDVTRHDLARVAAGAMWLMIAITALLMICAALTVMAGAASVQQLLGVSPFYWLSVLIAGLIGYTVLAAVSTFTVRAFELSVIAVLLLKLIVEILLAMPQSLRVLQIRSWLVTAPLESKYGLMNALGGLGMWGRSYLSGAPAPLLTTTWLAAALVWMLLSGLLLAGACGWNRWRWMR